MCIRDSVPPKQIVPPCSDATVLRHFILAWQQILAEKRGCQIIREGVISIERSDKDQFTLSLVSGRAIIARRVILATGAYLNLSNHLKPFLEKEVDLHLRTQTVSTAQVNPTNS